MNSRQFHLRSRVVLLLLGAVLAGFLWVLFELQVVNGSYYLEQSTRKIANTETVQASRGISWTATAGCLSPTVPHTR